MTEKRFVRFHREGDDFGGASHEQLVAMVESADPVAVMQVGQRLLLAAQKMDEISNELHAHMGGLEWEGQAADGFKTWGGNVSKSTMQLADYSRNAGTYMATAGETLSEVKSSMPNVPTSDMEVVRRYEAQPNTAVSVGGFIAGGMAMPGIGSVVGGWAADKVAGMVDSDWVTEEQAQAAQKRVDQAHQDAIQQMAKLGQSYDQSVTRLNSAEPPVFPPPPGSETGGSENVPVGGGTGGTGGGSGGSGRPAQMPTWTPPSGHQAVPTTPVHQMPTGPGELHTMPYPYTGQMPSTGIDHAPTMPTSPTAPTLPGGNPPGGTQPGGGHPLPGGGNLGGGLPGGGLPGGLPGGGLPGGGGLGGGRGGAGGGGLPGGRGGGGSTVGAGRAGGTAGAGGTGAGARPGGGAAGSTPGTGQSGRPGAPGMGGMPHGGGAGGAGAGGGGGRAGGGLVGRAGGAVGGRRGPAAGGEFTQGGTGLRGRAERGADGRSGQGGFGGGHGAGGAGRKDRNRGNRPDYLVEDEDTWTSGSGPVNPGVIE
ncbi:WXG100 family type VII secretion target [Streptomyces sp. NRRL B-24484]|uniref:WXG100 family type VII secretion target n=1 Tax=Streptomyces sp. NRRL B-24484 TaxID=1463833 RepID=UPI000694EFE6|nr:hypothetical protein [Streptomyces sp. NRRL B-24484]